LLVTLVRVSRSYDSSMYALNIDLQMSVD
jgi:hypothetical protein